MHPAQPYLLDDWFAEWLPDDPIYGPAARFLEGLVDTNPEAAWDFIVALIERAASDEALQCVAAGPLEDLLCDHGPQFIERAEHLARTNTRFRTALAIVRGETRMDASTQKRLRAVAGHVSA